MEARPAALIPLYAPRPEPVETGRKAYRPKEIAELYGLSESAVYKAIAAGRLMGKRIGRAHVVPVENIDAWLSRTKEER